MPVEAIAADMRIGVGRVQRLLEQEADRRELQQYTCDEVPVERIRDLFEARGEREPGFSIAELARLAGYKDPIKVSRLLGYAPTKSSTKNGKHYPGRLSTTINVEHAGRIVRALGFAAHEVEDL